MAKTLKKFDNIEELNSYLKSGKLVYTLASAGTAWLIEVDDSSENCFEVFSGQTPKKPVGSLDDLANKGCIQSTTNVFVINQSLAEEYLRTVSNGLDLAKILLRCNDNSRLSSRRDMLEGVISDLS